MVCLMELEYILSVYGVPYGGESSRGSNPHLLLALSGSNGWAKQVFLVGMLVF